MGGVTGVGKGLGGTIAGGIRLGIEILLTWPFWYLLGGTGTVLSGAADLGNAVLGYEAEIASYAINITRLEKESSYLAKDLKNK